MGEDTGAPEPGSRDTRDLLLRSPFARLWRAMLVSSLGDWVGIAAVASLVARFGSTASAGAAAIALVMATRFVTAIAFGPFAGVIVDRSDRRRAMIAADVGRAVLYGVIAFIPHLIVIAVCSAGIEALSSIWSPA